MLTEGFIQNQKQFANDKKKVKKQYFLYARPKMRSKYVSKDFPL